MSIQGEELYITYAHIDGLAFWQGKLTTLLRRYPFAVIINKQPITTEIYE